MDQNQNNNQANKQKKKKNKQEPKMENLNALADFPFEFVGPDKSVPKWTVQTNPDPNAPFVLEGCKPQVLLEARHADGRLVDGQVQQKRTYNLRENVVKQKPCTGMRYLLLSMRIGDVAWTKLNTEQQDN